MQNNKKDLNVTILLDRIRSVAYGKQCNAIDMYYNEDLSLSEIADKIDIQTGRQKSRLSKAKSILTNYEEKLRNSRTIS